MPQHNLRYYAIDQSEMMEQSYTQMLKRVTGKNIANSFSLWGEWGIECDCRGNQQHISPSAYWKLLVIKKNFSFSLYMYPDIIPN